MEEGEFGEERKDRMKDGEARGGKGKKVKRRSIKRLGRKRIKTYIELME